MITFQGQNYAFARPAWCACGTRCVGRYSRKWKDINIVWLTSVINAVRCACAVNMLKTTLRSHCIDCIAEAGCSGWCDRETVREMKRQEKLFPSTKGGKEIYISRRLASAQVSCLIEPLLRHLRTSCPCSLPIGNVLLKTQLQCRVIAMLKDLQRDRHLLSALRVHHLPTLGYVAVLNVSRWWPDSLVGVERRIEHVQVLVSILMKCGQVVTCHWLTVCLSHFL